MTGTIITWILAIVIFGGFALVVKRVYHNFTTGKSCCGSKGGCNGCSGCSTGIQPKDQKASADKN